MSWTATTELLAEKLPGYEDRVEQTNLAHAIEDTFAANGHLLGQAGCGVGKSFAYLVTAYFRALETRAPVVVATATKALQNQLSDKDLPFLQTLFPGLRFAVVKGRGNYLCQAKLNGADAQGVENLPGILTELDEREDHSGELDDLITEIRSVDRPNLTVVGDECPGRKQCPFGETCFAERAKDKAAEAHVVVANHALLIADIRVKNATNGKGGMLPHFQRGGLVVDECHELEEYTTNALGETFTKRALEIFTESVRKFLRSGDAGLSLLSASNQLFAKIEEGFTYLNPRTRRREPIRESTQRLDDRMLSDLVDELVAVFEAVGELRTAIIAYTARGEDESLAKKRMLRRADGLISRLSAIMSASSDELVRWIEREEKDFRGKKETIYKLAYAPLHVGPFLKMHIWDSTPAALVSATLATDDGFEYIAERLGLTGDYTGFDAGSPFDFAKQAVLYVPDRKFPEPSHATWQSRVNAEAAELIKVAGGRALLLFTSRKAMNEAHDGLLPTLRKLGVNVHKQGDAPTGKLAQRFKDDETSVLFGLRSFMTGADFQGDTCRLVIIDKLPFPVPSDVIFAARSEVIDRAKTGWNTGAFMKLSVPMMTLVLLQAFGRAIRTQEDKAVVAIFDPRLRIKGYGKGILRALPDARQVSDPEAAIQFLAAI
jgi:ATP-dependent DNA helicase DinG